MTIFVLICATMALAAIALIIRPLTGEAGRHPQRTTIAILAVGLPLTASLLYLKIGDPEVIQASPTQESPSGPPAPVMRVIQRAVSEPENFEAQLEAADLYYQIQRYDEAIAYLNKANHLRPDDAETMIRLGVANTEAGRLDAASAWLKSGLAKQPDNAVALDAYCLVLIHEGNTREAEAVFNRLERLDPNNPDLADMRANLQAR